MRATFVGIVLSKPSDVARTFDFGFVTPDGTPVYVDAKRTALVHANNHNTVYFCDPKKGQRHASRKRGPGQNYTLTKQKAVSNFDDKRRHIFLATTDTCGNLSDDCTRLLRFIARMQYHGRRRQGQLRRRPLVAGRRLRPPHRQSWRLARQC